MVATDAGIYALVPASRVELLDKYDSGTGCQPKPLQGANSHVTDANGMSRPVRWHGDHTRSPVRDGRTAGQLLMNSASALHQPLEAEYATKLFASRHGAPRGSGVANTPKVLSRQAVKPWMDSDPYVAAPQGRLFRPRDSRMTRQGFAFGIRLYSAHSARAG
jgi:hypothetical protein